MKKYKITIMFTLKLFKKKENECENMNAKISFCPFIKKFIIPLNNKINLKLKS